MERNRQSWNDHLNDAGILLLGAVLGTVFGLLFLENAVWGTVIGLVAALIFDLGRSRRRKLERSRAAGGFSEQTRK